MTFTYTPHRGSPFTQGTHRTNAKNAMLNIRTDNPNSTKAERISLFKEEARNNVELTDACVEMAAINADQAWESLQTTPTAPITPRELPAERQERQQQTRVRAAEEADRIDRACILDFIMPNDKPLRDCTFGEVGKFGRKFVKLSEAGSRNQKIGDVLSPEQADRLMR